MCNSENIWTFEPYDIAHWNKSESRIMLVAAEPNGGQGHGCIRDMGKWFRTAPEQGSHGNSGFYKRCKNVVDGYFSTANKNNLVNFKFLDLKATEGVGVSMYDDVAKYVDSHIGEVLNHFISKDEKFGFAPHVVVVMGGIAQMVFYRILREKIIGSMTTFQYAFMPHPSARMSNAGFLSGCKDLEINLRNIHEPPRKLCGNPLQWVGLPKLQPTSKQ